MVTAKDQERARRIAFRQVFGRELAADLGEAGGRAMSGTDALSYRDALDRARRAAETGYYVGLAEILRQAIKTKDAILERATIDVVSELDKRDPLFDWYGGVKHHLAHPAPTMPTTHSF